MSMQPSQLAVLSDSSVANSTWCEPPVGHRAASSAPLTALHGGAAAACDFLQLGRHRAVVAEPSMKRVFEVARRLARAAVPVVIHGETGVGKELVAAALHVAARRAAGPFVTLNCAAITESLAEAELFGYARGAFTGALAPRAGLLEASSGGTLFLDEIAELSASTQAKLLRVLESGELYRLGETTARPLDLRIVCASHKDLEAEVRAGRFRGDLFFRLGAARLEIPPLRQRPRDILALAREFLAAACHRAERRPMTLGAEAYRVLLERSWPGNVRELRHAIECAVAIADDDQLELRAEQVRALVTPQPALATPAPAPKATPIAGHFRPIAQEVEELERRRMVEALCASGGVKVSAAALIAMPMRTFVTKLRRYRIDSEDLRGEPGARAGSAGGRKSDDAARPGGLPRSPGRQHRTRSPTAEP
jgi:two-component system, NtrC family, response regulator AtoC